MTQGSFFKLSIDHLLAVQGSQLYYVDFCGGRRGSHALGERHQESYYQYLHYINGGRAIFASHS